MSLEGDDKDRVSVTGDNVDMVCLANQLKKKFSSVIILTVEDLKKKEEEEKKKKEEEKKKKEEEEKKKKEEEEKKKKAICAALCHGNCGKCSKYESSCKCSSEELCVIIDCSKCQSPKCNGDCKPCSNCHNKKCHGCKPSPPPSYYPYPTYNPYPPNCQVVYDPCHSDTCSIM